MAKTLTQGPKLTLVRCQPVVGSPTSILGMEHLGAVCASIIHICTWHHGNLDGDFWIIPVLILKNLISKSPKNPVVPVFFGRQGDI